MQSGYLEQLFGLDGQVAVVTGGGGGLGRELAHALARAGAAVAVITRRAESCEPVAAEIRAAGGKALAVPCDVTDEAALHSAVATIQSQLGPIDILVNGAGGNSPKATTTPEQSFFDIPREGWHAVVSLNLLGTLLPCQIVGRAMAERRRGCIINITSMAADRPLTRVGGYGAAKAAVVNFTKWLAVHMANEYDPAIRVNAISPGFFLTEQNRYLLTDRETGEMTARGRLILDHTPAGRLGDAPDLAAALLWLTGAGAAFVTGAVIPVDGGFSAFSGV